MLNKNINKVRRIAKAYYGLSIPSGNPYMTTNELAIPGNAITQQNLLGTDYSADFRNRAEQIMAPTNSLIDFNARMGDLFSLKLKNDRDSSKAITQIKSMSVGTAPQKSQGTFQKLGGWNTVGQASDFLSGLIGGDKDGYLGKYGSLQQAGDQAFDQASNVVMGINPLVGGIMKAGGLVSDVLTKWGGMGTDSMTKTDAVLGSKLLSLTPVGMVNGFFGKKTRDFSANRDTIEQVGGSYGGTVRNIASAEEKAGKKYGLFSGGARRSANRFINRTESQQATMTNIANEASDLSSIATNMSDLNHIQYGFNLNGGYDQRYMRAARLGTKLQRIKKLNIQSHKLGGQIQGAIDLNEWQPVITEAVEQFESGGELEWTPIITLQEGGKTEKVDGITGAAPKITFQSWYDTVPKDRLSNNYDLKKAFEVLPFEELEAWRKSSDEDLRIGKNHLRSIYQLPNGDYEFLKLGNEQSNPEVHFETDTYHSGENGLKDSHDLVFEKDRYFYRRKPKQFKNGGKPEPIDAPEIEETNQKNIIPEGALHARKHNMENADNLTKKGIPVIDNEGEQQAEIEKNEIIFTLEVTKKLEELYSKYTDYEYSQKEKDEVAIEAGKLLVKEILFNTDDRTGLINTLKQGGIIDGLK